MFLIDDIDNNNILKLFLEQSLKKKFTPLLNSNKDVDYHKDGFGFAFLDKNKKWSIYKKPICYKDDKELNNFLDNLSSNIIIGHIRSICPNNKNISVNNTHPFIFEDNIWCHNGSVKNLDSFKIFANNIIKDKFVVKGNTDSELLFYIFLKILDNKKDLNKLIKSIILFFLKLKKIDFNISANIIYSSKKYTFISRFVNKDEISPSLYFNNIVNGILISSEPLSTKYNLFPNKHVIIIDNQKKDIIVNLKLDKI